MLLYCTFCYVRTCFVWWMSPLCLTITCRQIQGIPTCEVICSQKYHGETTKKVSDRSYPKFLIFGRRESYPMFRKSSWTGSNIHTQAMNLAALHTPLFRTVDLFLAFPMKSTDFFGAWPDFHFPVLWCTWFKITSCVRSWWSDRHALKHRWEV